MRGHQYLNRIPTASLLRFMPNKSIQRPAKRAAADSAADRQSDSSGVKRLQESE
jgi:hypothetical protein